MRASSLKVNILFLVLIGAAAAFSVASGKVWIPWDAWSSGDPRWLIIAELRFPRTLLAMVLGASLGAAGAVMQGYLRNPLADPGLFGISSGAALGAVSSLYFGYASATFLLPVFALAGAGIAMMLLALLAGRSGSLIMFALAGMILASIAGSATTLVISLAPTPYVASEIVNWLMGTLTDRSWDDVRITVPVMGLGIAVLLTTGRSLDALTLGEAAARSMGINEYMLQWKVVIGVGLCVGGSVAAAGIVGFVGLMVPHIVRPIVGARPSAVILPSALGGALLLLIADSLVRISPTVTELRLGIVMSMLGAPFFLAMLLRLRKTQT
ncbi:iron complex transport system permease protein [Steroidobacter denitrificans]|uniref:Iron complex transport system permease protein n=1 Tax=Steroidobacter denitrificans TaxID=465721 RepID=A0A127FDH7_STEDE|nr:iron ABC transporter permease [Steroidobacter denitrificans]AMN48412.1 iron complex transport system permease protein [Steroidobacter denitrificans]